MASLANVSGLALAFSRMKLCPITALGMVPTLLSRTVMVSPGFASMVVLLNFIWSLASISTSRPDAAAAAAGFAVAGAGAAGFWVADACANRWDGSAMAAAPRSNNNARFMVTDVLSP